MLATSAAVAGVDVLSKLLEITVAAGIRGSSVSGNPATIVPTMAEVPGDAVGLADAVMLALPDAGEDVAEEDGVTPGSAGLQAARASMAPVANAANPEGLRLLMTVTGTVLLVLMPDSASSLVSTNRYNCRCGA
jgi:hypothetical protein